VTGSTNSGNFPTVNPYQANLGGSNDAFISELNVAGTDLLGSTYLGGMGNDSGYGIGALGNSGNVLVDGTAGPAFPTTPGAFQPNYGGGNSDAFVAAINLAPQLTIIDVIPTALSNEVNQDSEPTIAVAPTDDPKSRTVAISTYSRTGGQAFSQDNLSSGAWGLDRVDPLWVSTNGGSTWNQKDANPKPPGSGNGPGDRTLAYNSTGSQLYGAFLESNRNTFDVRSTPNPSTTTFGGGSIYTSTGTPDQPWIVASGQQSVYIAFNDGGAAPNSACVIISTNGGATFGGRIRLDIGSPQGQDSPPRVAVQGNKVYGLFARPTAAPGATTEQADIVVVRDDNGGAGNPPFQALGGAQGAIVESGLVPVEGKLNLGQERIGADYSIAIDPSDTTGNTVYIAYVIVNNNQPEIHVRKSADGGTTWANALAPISNAALPALAVTAHGNLGLLYTRLTGGNMSTEFYQQTAAGGNGHKAVLAAWPVNSPIKTFDPYIADYQQLLAVGDTFYGTFSASNNPLVADFPSGVFFQRDINVKGKVQNNFNLTQDGTLDDGSGPPPAPGKSPAVSIDPFFFTVPAG
jgi:hypothetical protein